MNFEKLFATLDFQPIDTLPWELNTEFDPPLKYMPLGLVLKSAPGLYRKFVLVGNDIDGEWTKGCNCCANEWKDAVHDYEGWAWAFPQTNPVDSVDTRQV